MSVFRARLRVALLERRLAAELETGRRYANAARRELERARAELERLPRSRL